MYPVGHALNETFSLPDILQFKFSKLGQLALDKEELVPFLLQLENIGELTNDQLHDIYDCNIKIASESVDTGSELDEKD